MKRVLCLFLCVAFLLTCVTLPSFAAEYNCFSIESIEPYCIFSQELAKDGYLGIPVGIKTYSKGVSTAKSPVILYVVNTNTERIGTDSDEAILTSMLERGYVVVVLDYQNHAAAVSPGLDWSIQGIRNNVGGGQYLANAPCDAGVNYVVPSGYNVKLNDVFWSIDKHGADGCLDQIVDVWNNDFKSVKKDHEIHYADGTTKKVGDVTAKDIYDCVKPDGTPIDLDLYMDIIYPTNPAQKVPVYTLMSSSETRVATWTNARRPHLTGFLFQGYAGVIFDYAYVPMARNDHYGYFDGNSSAGHITGDNYTYSLGVYSGVKSDTAAIRRVRWLADHEADTYKFDVNKIGVYGNSKGGFCLRLGNAQPELLQERRWFDGQHGETRFENGDTQNDGLGVIDGGEVQPWLTYRDGTPIPSNVQFVFSNCGTGQETLSPGSAPMYSVGTMLEGGSYPYYYGTLKNYARIYDIPFVGFTNPTGGHEFGFGPDGKYGLDVYDAFYEVANYWLKDDNAILKYIDIGAKTTEVKTSPVILFQFTGPIPENEIQKVSITDDATGEAAQGVWKPSYGNTTWEFYGNHLKGGAAYTVNVPQTVLAENGKPLAAAKALQFKTKHESRKDAAAMASNADMTLLKTESTDNGVFLVYDSADFANSTTTQLRFCVENDAANTVMVYAAATLDEANPENSTVGELLGEIVLTGTGEYEIDVTDYVKSLGSGEKAAFILKAKNNQETKTVTKYDFENAGEGNTSVTGVSFFNDVSREVSSDLGSKSVKINYVRPHAQSTEKSKWIECPTRIAVFGDAIKASKLTAADYGKKFRFNIDIYDTKARLFQLVLKNWTTATTANPEPVDWNAHMYNYQTEPDKWTTYGFDYRVKNPLQWTDLDERTVEIDAAPTAQSDNRPIYFDNVIVTEEITDVKIADSNTAGTFAPSLVLHPAVKETLRVTDSAYVESGDRAGEVMDGGSLFVNGRMVSGREDHAKAYVKLSLAGYDGSQVSFGFRSNAGDKGNLQVYGISDTTAAEGWSGDSISYLNAPANDRYGYGVHRELVYGNAPLDEIAVNGAANYALDITDYASYMLAQGAQSITLVFVNSTEPEQVLCRESFDSAGGMAGIVGGGLSMYGRTSDEDHTTGSGYSYFMRPSSYAWERLRFDLLGYESLTKEDIGKKYRITYWAKANTTGTFFNATMALGSADNNHNRVYQTVDAADTWQKFTYEFTLTEQDIVNPADPRNGIFALIDFELSGMGVGEKSVTLYLDDFVAEEIEASNVTITPVEADGGGAGVVVANLDFEDWTAGTPETKGDLQEVNSYKDTLSSGGFGYGDRGKYLAVTSEEDHTTGTGKSFLFTPQESWNRIRFYNLFDHNLTEADVGRQMEISFWAKSDTEGITLDYGLTCGVPRDGTSANYPLEAGETADTKDYSISGYPVTNTAVLSTEWKPFKFTVNVDKTMLPKTVNIGGKTPYEAAIALLGFFSNSSSAGKKVYIDDIQTVEMPVLPFSYGQNFEAVSNVDNVASGNGLDMAATEPGGSAKYVDTYTINAGENHTPDGAKSLQLYSTAFWNRFKLLNIMDTALQDDIGKEYKVSFYMKSNKTGTFKVGLIGKNDNKYGFAANAYATTDYSVEEANVWKKYTYTFTVTEELADNEINCLLINPSGFGQSKVTHVGADNKTYLDSADPAILLIDDLYATETTSAVSATLPVSDTATIHGLSGSTPELRAVRGGAEMTPQAIRKTYLRFAGGAYDATLRAELNIDIEAANGQTIQVYGVTGGQYPESGLTYENAPANGESEAMKAGEIYGGAPLAEFVADGAGTYRVDVTEYVKNHAPNTYLFALASHDAGGTEYVNLNFEMYPFSEGTDYTAFGGYRGSVRVTGGAAVVEGVANAGEGIQLLHVFGNDNAVCKTGETYTVSADVTPLGSEGAYPVTMGLCTKDGSVPNGASITEMVSATETKRITLTYTAGANDGLSGLVFYGGAAGGFKLDNVSVQSRNVVSLGAKTSLSVEKAQDSGGGAFAATVTIKSFDAASATAVIEAETAGLATVIFAGYTDSRLTAVKTVTVQLQQGENRVTADNFSLAEAESGCIFVWGDLISLKPLCKPYVF